MLRATRITTITTAMTMLDDFLMRAGLAAVGAIVHGSALLVRETQIAVALLSDRATRVRAQMPSEMT